jgi:hypothetical protein
MRVAGCINPALSGCLRQSPTGYPSEGTRRDGLERYKHRKLRLVHELRGGWYAVEGVFIVQEARGAAEILLSRNILNTGNRNDSQLGHLPLEF